MDPSEFRGFESSNWSTSNIPEKKTTDLSSTNYGQESKSTSKKRNNSFSLTSRIIGETIPHVNKDLKDKSTYPLTFAELNPIIELINTHKKNRSCPFEHVKEMAELFRSTEALNTRTNNKPLDHHNPKANHANDVYMTNFSKMDKDLPTVSAQNKTYLTSEEENFFDSSFEDSFDDSDDPWDPYKQSVISPDENESEDVDSVSAEPSEDLRDVVFKPDLRDVVFKPGKDVAIRSKICFGLVQKIKSLEHVIVAAKSGRASVVAKYDHEVIRTEVFNPKTNRSYLIEDELLNETISLKNIKENDNVIEGMIGNHYVKLEPVKERSGFYLLTVIKKVTNEVDESKKVVDPSTNNVSNALEINESEKESLDLTEEDFEGCIVMPFTTSLPSKIDGWVKDGASWIKLKIRDKSEKKEVDVLAPSKEIIQIIEKENTHTFIDEKYENPIKNENKSITIENKLQKNHKKTNIPDRFIEINNTIYSIFIKEDNTFELYSVENGAKKDIPKESVNDIRELATNYTLVKDAEEKLGLVPNTALVPFNENTIPCDGKNYSVKEIEKDKSFIISEIKEVKINDEENFIILNDADEEDFEWLQTDLITIKHGKKYVSRNDQDYEMTEVEGEGIKVVGKNILGMIQFKVGNLFTKFKVKEEPEIKGGSSDVKAKSKKEKTLNITIPSPEREKFYQRIHMPSFIQAFIATILLRSEDTKICDLGESNVLFQIIPTETNEKNEDKTFISIDSEDFENEMLCPIIIDLDETMPKENDNFVKDNPEIYAMRNGFMGFPQARKVLSSEEKSLALECLADIVKKKKPVSTFLSNFIEPNSSFDKIHVDAYEEIVDKIDIFITNQPVDWSLETLFFFTFPSYEEQWKKLGDDIDPQKKAMHIGKDSVESVLKKKEYFDRKDKK